MLHGGDSKNRQQVRYGFGLLLALAVTLPLRRAGICPSAD